MCAPQPPPLAEMPVQPAAKRPVTPEDVQKVHVLLEACIKRCMTKEQSVSALQRLGVEPLFTRLVWERLELENPEFFASYNTKLAALESLHTLQLAA